MRQPERFRGGLVFKAHRLCVSLNSRLESNKERESHLAKRGDLPAHGPIAHPLNRIMVQGLKLGDTKVYEP